MMQPRYAKAAADLLRQQMPGSVPPPSAAARRTAIAALEAAIVRRARARRRWQWSVASAAAVVLLVGGGVAQRVLNEPAQRTTPAKTGESAIWVSAVSHRHESGDVHQEGPRRAEDRSEAAPGSVISTHGRGQLLVQLPSGSELKVDDGSEVRLAERGSKQVFELRQGRLQAHVAKLLQGERFVIKTLDSEVEVRGTRFTVAVGNGDANCEGGTTTRVDVQEGVVEVRHGERSVRLGVGQQWPECSVPEVSQSPQPALRSGSAVKPVSTSGSARAPLENSALAEQNDLFALGLSYKRRGETELALGTFERFLTRYPHAALSENAVVERFRLLLPVDSARAAEVARQYLRHYPKGFARAEAQSLVEGSR